MEVRREQRVPASFLSALSQENVAKLQEDRLSWRRRAEGDRRLHGRHHPGAARRAQNRLAEACAYNNNSDPLEKEMPTHSRILVWKSHGQRSLAATVNGVANSRTRLSD